MYVEDIIAASRRVLDGDSEALQELGLDSISYPKPTPLNTSAAHIQVIYNAVLNTAVAARELQLGFIEKQCQELLDTLKAIAVAKGISVQHNVHGVMWLK